MICALLALMPPPAAAAIRTIALTGHVIVANPGQSSYSLNDTISGTVSYAEQFAFDVSPHLVVYPITAFEIKIGSNTFNHGDFPLSTYPDYPGHNPVFENLGVPVIGFDPQPNIYSTSFAGIFGVFDNYTGYFLYQGPYGLNGPDSGKPSYFIETLLDDDYRGAAIVTFEEASSAGPSAVAEPATWALMMVGFGAIGGAIRRGRHAADPQRA